LVPAVGEQLAELEVQHFEGACCRRDLGQVQTADLGASEAPVSTAAVSVAIGQVMDCPTGLDLPVVA
jgi:hypothetical protein